jgi:hypothetical protein
MAQPHRSRAKNKVRKDGKPRQPHTYKATAENHLLSHIAKQTNGCWQWLGVRKKGYGHTGREGRTYRAHRLACETWIGPIPKGLQVQHLCNHRACCNPAHLVVGTNAANVYYSIASGRTKTKLTPRQAAQVKWLALHSRMTQVAIAKLYGVAADRVAEIKKGRAWADVKPELSYPPLLPTLVGRA